MVMFNQPELFHKYMLEPYRVKHNKEWYRVISHGFIHADWSHLIFNMMTLYFAGQTSEKILVQIFSETGAVVAFVLIYLLGMVIAALPALIKHGENPSYRSLGASGAVATMLFFFIMFYPLAKINIFFIPIDIPAWLFGVLYLAAEYYLDKKQQGNVAHDAHFTGALFGIVAAIVVFPNVASAFVNQIVMAIQNL